VVSGDWLYGRTSRGEKFMTLAHNPWCAFEVDEVRDLFDWDSVVVKGRLELLDPQVASPDAYEEGLKLMGALVPGAFTEVDPVPHRLILFRVHLSEITGRSARPAR
jgi:nitroimidazol reductase NimA-like FMN-containing flavoprotein (pyridoxamine 5'-phosphate oxidase superfamily)